MNTKQNENQSKVPTNKVYSVATHESRFRTRAIGRKLPSIPNRTDDVTRLGDATAVYKLQRGPQ